MRYICVSIALVLLLIWSCENAGEPVEIDSRAADEQAILSIINEIEDSDTADYFYADLDEETEDQFIEPEYEFLAKPVIPLKYGRVGLRPLVRDIRVEFTSDTSARVVFFKVLHGRFRVVTMDSSYMLQRIERKMGHKFHRIAYFVKRGAENESLRRRWHMVATSVVDGKSLGVVDSTRIQTTLHILKLSVEYADTILVIEDPLNFIQRPGSILTLPTGSEVRVTAHVRNDAQNKIRIPTGKGSELVRLHFGRHRNWRSVDMYGIRYMKWIGQTADGVNIYQGNWTVKAHFRINHAVIDVIDNGCIFNDDIQTYPYNSVTWGMPYRIKPM